MRILGRTTDSSRSTLGMSIRYGSQGRLSDEEITRSAAHTGALAKSERMRHSQFQNQAKAVSPANTSGRRR